MGELKSEWAGGSVDKVSRLSVDKVSQLPTDQLPADKLAVHQALVEQIASNEISLGALGLPSPRDLNKDDLASVASTTASAGGSISSGLQSGRSQARSPVDGVQKGKALSDLRILVAEDNEDMWTLTRLYLVRAGAIPIRAANGADAVSMACHEEVSLVLMDIQMPVMDGLSAARELRKQGFEKPILALTAHAMKFHRELSIESGCNEHLTKPIDPRTLVDKITHYCRGDVVH